MRLYKHKPLAELMHGLLCGFGYKNVIAIGILFIDT